MGDIFERIRANIYKFLMKYNRGVGGVVLAVSDMAFADGRGDGIIHDEMPHIHYNVTAKAQVFRPQAGNLLVGRVNKVTSTHVGMLVCGIFNASVTAEELESKYEYDELSLKWQERGGEGGIITLGAELRFAVKRLHEAAGLISVEGSLSDQRGRPLKSGTKAERQVLVEGKGTAKEKKKGKEKRRKTIG
ncbi:unnamed protein product [Discosporangium mesarthrocarpum]